MKDYLAQMIGYNGTKITRMNDKKLQLDRDIMQIEIESNFANVLGERHWAL